MAGQNAWAAIPRHIRKKLRDAVFQRDGYVCRIQGPKCTGRAEELDHITPRSVDPDRILDPSNCRAACRQCNRGRGNNMTGTPSRAW